MSNLEGKGASDGRRLSRRQILKLGVGVVAGAIGIEATRELCLWDQLRQLLHRNGELVNARRTFLDILNSQPDEGTLEGRIFNHGNIIDLDSEQQAIINRSHGKITDLAIDVLVVGDSNCFESGLKNDHGGPDNQPSSFAQIAQAAIAPSLSSLNIKQMRTFTYAIPGAPSGEGFPQDGILGPMQMGSTSFKENLENGSQLKEVVWVGTGDDWRELVANAPQLISVFSTVLGAENASDTDLRNLLGLKDSLDAIGSQYGKNLQRAVEQVADVNTIRINQGLPGVKFIPVHPLSLLHAHRIPFKTLDGDDSKFKGLEKYVKKVSSDPKDARYYLDLDNIPYGQQIAYLITVAMYRQLETILPQLSQRYPDLDIVPLEFMGLEQTPNFYSIDGHPGQAGIKYLAQALLNISSRGSASENEKPLGSFVTHI